TAISFASLPGRYLTAQVAPCRLTCAGSRWNTASAVAATPRSRISCCPLSRGKCVPIPVCCLSRDLCCQCVRPCCKRFGRRCPAYRRLRTLRRQPFRFRRTPLLPRGHLTCNLGALPLRRLL